MTFPFTAFSNICIRTHINQNDDKSITVNQESYAKTINPIHLNKDQISPSTTPSRRTAQLQRTAGKTNLACWNIQTRKSFQICEISIRLKSATVAHIKATNKVARFATSIPNSIMFPRKDVCRSKL